MIAMREKAAPLKRVIEVLNDVVQMALNFLINKVAPVAIFCMIARAFAVYGVEYISPTLVWIATTIVVSLLLVVTIYPIGIFLTTRLNPFTFLKKSAKIGIPSGIENGMFQIGKIVVVGMVATLGTDAIAANSIAFQIIDFPNIPGTSIGLAMVTIIGQCVGAKDMCAAKFYTKKLMIMTYIGDWACKWLLFAFAPLFVNIFSLSPSASDTAVFVLRCFSIASLVGWPLSFALTNALRAAGDVNFSLGVSMISMWIFRIVCSYILVMVLGMGVLGVWIGMFVDWYARAVAYLARYLSGRWKKHRMV